VTTIAEAFDPGLYFERWLQEISGQKPTVSEITDSAEAEDSQFYLGSFPGSNCEVTFDGLLHFDGYSIGNINSPQGTLVLTQRGRIEADIEVAVAVINGSVTGNISASERVVLDSNARVTGLIRTRALSIRLGAIFDGDCIFIDVAENFWAENGRDNRHPEMVKHYAVGANA
jgi:cytoskeletal protein CcmA (bactofilin family)